MTVPILILVSLIVGLAPAVIFIAVLSHFSNKYPHRNGYGSVPRGPK